MITLLYGNMDILVDNFLFLVRGHAGRRWVPSFPTTSPLFLNMSQFTINQVRTWYLNNFFSSSPMLCVYTRYLYARSQYTINWVRTRYSNIFFSSPPILWAYSPFFYPAPGWYLAFCAVSISSRQLVLRRPLPMLARIAASKYRVGLYEKLGSQWDIAVPLPLRLLRAYQSGVSTDFISRRRYELIKECIDMITANTETMNFATCLGFQTWHSLMPCILQCSWFCDIKDLINPEIVAETAIKSWSPSYIEDTPRIYDDLYNMLPHEGEVERGGSGVSYRAVLRKLVIACLGICLLSAVAYTNASGTELSNSLSQLNIDDNFTNN